MTNLKRNNQKEDNSEKAERNNMKMRWFWKGTICKRTIMNRKNLKNDSSF